MSKSEKNSYDLYPDITYYKEIIHYGLEISSENLEDIIKEVELNTSLDNNTAKLITKLFFEEIRNSMLKGEVVKLKQLGSFYIISPKITDAKIIKPHFRPSKKLKTKLKLC